LFLSGDSAAGYRAAAQLDDRWQMFRPGREPLRDVLRASVQSGIRFAVLDPDGRTARRIFDLAEILRQAEEGDGGPNV
jgi:hypothetical protein